MKLYKRIALLTAVTLAVALPVIAGSVKSWSGGETITSADLNATVTHIHNKAERSLVNADINASAAIAHSKLATPSLLPKAWGVVSPICTGACTIAQEASSPGDISTVVRNSTGDYTVTLATARADTTYFAITSVITTNDVVCHTDPPTSTTVFKVVCRTSDPSVGAAANADAAFSFVVFDNN